MSKIYKREDYLKRIRGLYNDSSMIKIITGILGCGKTFLLKSIIEELLDNGVLDKDIIYIELDKIEYKNIKEDIKNYVSSFYDNHTRLNKNIERGR